MNEHYGYGEIGASLRDKKIASSPAPVLGVGSSLGPNRREPKRHRQKGGRLETGISKKVLRKIPPPLAYVVIPYMILVSKPREGTFRYRERMHTWRLLFLILCKTGFLQIVHRGKFNYSKKDHRKILE